MLTLVERKSGVVHLCRVASGDARPTLYAIMQALNPLREHVHTITWDIGSEFAEHRLVDHVLGADSYFADPYTAWQRGSNENTNGLLRQYLPKGSAT